MTATKKPLRILHVVGAMNRAGIETWLMNVLRSIDRSKLQMEFLVEEYSEAEYDREICELGSKIHRIGSKRSPFYTRRILDVLRKEQPFDVVHSHMHFFDAVVLRAAAKAKVLGRISHSHNDTTNAKGSNRLLRRYGESVLRYGINRYSTLKLAVSQQAATSLFGGYWRNDDSCRILMCGIDFQPYAETYSPETIRAELGLSEQDWVIGSVGRFVDQKNHEFLVRSFADVAAKDNNARLLLVGAGPLRAKVEQLASDLGVLDLIRFAGSRSDIPQILCSVVNVFAFPSKYEGLGIAYLEAQAAGLPCVVSPAVPEEADVASELIHRVPIDNSWGSAFLASRYTQRQPFVYLNRLKCSQFSIQRCVDNLHRAYASCFESRSLEK
jgi:glycosyltransferase involved in cell wall biosynthesis